MSDLAKRNIGVTVHNIFTGGCPAWSDGKHNETTIKGWLPWRRYAICVSCGNSRRIQRSSR